MKKENDINIQNVMFISKRFHENQTTLPGLQIGNSSFC